MARFGNISQELRRFGQIRRALIGKIRQIRHDPAKFDKIWRDLARFDKIGKDVAIFDEIGKDWARLRKIWPDLALFRKIWPELAGRCGGISQDFTGFGEIFQVWKASAIVGEIWRDLARFGMTRSDLTIAYLGIVADIQ